MNRAKAVIGSGTILMSAPASCYAAQSFLQFLEHVAEPPPAPMRSGARRKLDDVPVGVSHGRRQLSGTDVHLPVQNSNP